MAQVVGISGRLVEGATLSAVAGGFTGALGAQWQAFVNGVWVDVGVPNGTFTVPAGAAGTIYRVVVEGVASAATAPVTLDTRKESAPSATWGSTPLLIPAENGPALRLFQPLTLTDSDKSGFAGGSLQVFNTNALSAGGDGHDHLGVVFAGTAAGQFSYNASTREVSYAFSATSIKVVGQLDAQADGQGRDLKVVFNANATAAVVDALINNIEYASVGDDSPVADRILTLRVTDATGRAAQYAHHVAIANDPDAPVILSPAEFEIDENQTAVGTVAARDPDVEPEAPQGITYSLASGAGDTHNAAFTIDAATGALSLVDAADYELRSTYEVRVRAADANGGVTEQPITVRVRNVNEAPSAVEEPATAMEDGPPVAITPHVVDPDFGDTWTVTLDTSATVGQVSWVDGRFMYDPAGAFQSLGSYSMANDSFQYTVTDAGGLSVTRTVTVPVFGSNDAATISGTHTAVLTEDSGIGQWGHLWASGAVTVSDPDQNESRLGWGPVDFNFSANSDGTWTYHIDNAQLQWLGEGQSYEVSYTLRSYDGTATLPVVITVNGVNDAPVAYGGLIGTAIESNESDAGRSVMGMLGATDADADDSVSWTPMNVDGTYGRFVLDGWGGWSYTPDNTRSATNALGDAQVATETFTVVATDNHGASAQAQVTVRVQGRNDAPVITGGTSDGSVVEAGVQDDGQPMPGVPSALGTLTAWDAETPSGTAGTSASMGAQVLTWSGSANGTYGTFSIGSTSGDWAYTLDNDRAATQALAEGQSVEERFTVTLTDPQGATAQREVVIQVQGSNDFPAVSTSSDTSGYVLEDATLTDSGSLFVVNGDPDAGDQLAWTGGGQGQYGALVLTPQGTWTYTLDNDDWETQALGAGETATEYFPATLADTFGATSHAIITVTVVGANEVPEIYAEPTSLEAHVLDSSVEYPGVLTASGTLQAYDRDMGDALTWSGSQDSAYGDFQVDPATGTWTYTLDTTAADPLGQQDWVTETFTLTVNDGNGGSDFETVTIHVHGVNDAPVPQAGTGDTGTVLTAAPPDGTLVHDIANDGILYGGSLMAVDAQGRLLLAGGDGSGMLLERLNADGSIDRSFGAGGVQPLTTGGQLSHVGVDPVSGAIVLSGHAYTGYGPGGTYVDYALTRLLPDGSIDPSFGTNGNVLVDIAGSYDYGANVMFLPDGDLLVAGAGQLLMPDGSHGAQDLVLVRLNADGSLDTDFGNAGKWVFEGDGNYTGSHRVLMDGAGRLVIWGVGEDPATGGYQLQVFRFDAEGTADTTFGNLGRIDVPLGYEYPYTRVSLATAADGSIALGWADHNYWNDQYELNLVRLTADGQLEPGFGYGGRLGANVGAYPGGVGLAIDASGAVLVGGATTSGSASDPDMMLLRVLADGTIDPAFAGGMATADLGGFEQVDALFLQPNGDVLLAGIQAAVPPYQTSEAFIGLARFNVDGSLDTGFGSEPDAKTSGQLAATDPEGEAWPNWSTEASSTYVVDGAYGSFSLTPWGAWTYTVDNSLPATQALAPGQEATDTFAVRVADSWGVGTTHDVVITIVGNVDAAP